MLVEVEVAALEMSAGRGKIDMAERQLSTAKKGFYRQSKFLCHLETCIFGAKVSF